MDLNITPADKRELLRLARQTIARGCTHGESPAVDIDNQPEALKQTLACFVTLQKQENLEGVLVHLTLIVH